MLSCGCPPAFGLIITGFIVRSVAPPYDELSAV